MDVTLYSALTQVVVLEDDTQVGEARRTATTLAQQAGFDENDCGRVALVATELASNILKHARHGEMHLRALPALGGLELIAVDRGPGFDLHDCLPDGYSTRGTQGIGLGALRRQSQVFDVYADERGAVVLVRLFAGRGPHTDWRLGISQHSLHHDPACGDAWQVTLKERQLSALVIDGLGHGTEAQLAARAGCQAFNHTPFASPALLFDDLHQAMNGTRGGAVAVAQYDGDKGHLRFTGIGNIGACLVTPEKSRGMASHPGIVGAQFRRAQPFDFGGAGGQLLILYSDGLQSRWNLLDYPGLVHRHPAVIAAVLHRDFCRGRDDVTVLVIALEAPDV